MGRKYHKDEILKLDAKHYTLFPNRTNIIEKTEEEELYWYTITVFLIRIMALKESIIVGTVYTDALKIKKMVCFLQHLQRFIKKRSIYIFLTLIMTLISLMVY